MQWDASRLWMKFGGKACRCRIGFTRPVHESSAFRRNVPKTVLMDRSWSRRYGWTTGKPSGPAAQDGSMPMRVWETHWANWTSHDMALIAPWKTCGGMGEREGGTLGGREDAHTHTPCGRHTLAQITRSHARRERCTHAHMLTHTHTVVHTHADRHATHVHTSRPQSHRERYKSQEAVPYARDV